MKGFKSELSITISRKQMIEVFQKYYNEKRENAILSQKTMMNILKWIVILKAFILDL